MVVAPTRIGHTKRRVRRDTSPPRSSPTHRHRQFRLPQYHPVAAGLPPKGFLSGQYPPLTVFGVVVLFGYRRELDLLLAGDELASSRGLQLNRFRCIVLGATSVVIGGIVAVTGPIGFVGLIVPHMLRRWVGQEHLYLIPACALGGGAFLAICDLAARTAMAPAELPVGIITALLGGPFFVWLLLRRRIVN